MATIYQLPMQVPGMVGVFPNQKFAVFGDNLATVTTAGYLNQVNLESNPIAPTDILQVLYSFNPQTQSGTYATFTVSISNSGVITLAEWSVPGAIVTPTIANHIATFTNTTGTISEDPATAISGGNIQAGLSGTAGFLASFPSTAATGSLRLTAVANSGNTVTTISNVAMGQASVVSIPDPANAAGRFLVGATATPFVSGNFPVASGTGGLMVDSGVSAASLPTFTSPTIANHIAVFTNTTGNLGEDATTAINGGNIQAGLSGTAGSVASFPGTVANGELILAAVNAGGAFNTTISNSTMGQSSVISIPDPGAATAKFLLDSGSQSMATGSQLNLAKANGVEAANAVTASGNAGVITTSSLTTAGGATYAITWTNTHISSTSVGTFTIQGGTNTVQNITFTFAPGAGTATLTIYNNTAATNLNGTILIGYTIL